MNIAVIINKDIREGGAFQYCLSITLFLEKKKSEKYNFIFFTTIKENIEIFKKSNIKCFYFNWSNLDEFFSYIYRSQLLSNIFRKFKMKLNFKFDHLLRKYDIDLIYFISPSTLSLATNSFNFIFSVWDLCFSDSMEFPELYADKEFERRDELYKIAARKAIAVITESSFTKRDLIRKYNVDERRIVCFPMPPSDSVNISKQEYEQNYIDIKKKYNIKGDYIFYPAQFWPHKNHSYILEGLKILKEKYGKVINAVFAGSDKGNLKFVLKKAKELAIYGQIYYIGFAKNKEMPYLYRQALALVMPTYLGPTNMPPLEAFKLGCPVLYSDLPDLKEQVKDAAILIDLKNPESMCRGLLKIIEDSPEIKVLIENGKEKIENLTKLKEEYWVELKNIFDDYSFKLKTWK